MNFDTEFEKIKDYIANLSETELDAVLFDCGIELIRPSIDSDYIKCLRHSMTDKGYRKTVFEYSVKEEYFDTEIGGQEVA